MQESDLKKLFPKATSIAVTPAAGPRPGLVLLFPKFLFHCNIHPFLVMLSFLFPMILRQPLLLNKVLHFKIHNLK
jgi:hypothetical protein